MSTLWSEKYPLFLLCNSPDERLGLLRDLLSKEYELVNNSFLLDNKIINEDEKLNNNINDNLKNTNPLWMFFVENKFWECISELLLSQENINEEINKRNKYNQGWLHLTILYNAPDIIIKEGMEKLNKDWFYTDDNGKTPLHLLPSAKITQSILIKIWTEDPANQRKVKNLFNDIIKLAKNKKRYDIVRTVNLWSR